LVKIQQKFVEIQQTFVEIQATKSEKKVTVTILGESEVSKRSVLLSCCAY